MLHWNQNKKEKKMEIEQLLKQNACVEVKTDAKKQGASIKGHVIKHKT